jgi:hypothetical protein
MNKDNEKKEKWSGGDRLETGSTRGCRANDDDDDDDDEDDNDDI